MVSARFRAGGAGRVLLGIVLVAIVSIGLVMVYRGSKVSPDEAQPCDPAELGASADPGEPDPVNDFAGVSFSCAVLRVPLNHPGLHAGVPQPGELALRFAIADNDDAPRGVLVRLVGGPGEPGVAMAADITAHEIAPQVLKDYRVVFLNQRGTGPNALQCPQLQQANGAADLAIAPAEAVRACSEALGDDRRFYSTADSVADLEALRVRLGVDKLTLDGSSYGTLVAERYALAYPNRVARLVLDSVIPHDGLDQTQTAVFPRAAQVLAMACRETHCTTDPVADLATVVRVRHDGPLLLAVLTGLTSGKPQLDQVPAVLHAAAGGKYTKLDAMVANDHKQSAADAQDLSQGLHTATACQDLLRPWAGASVPVDARANAVASALANRPDAAFFPFDRDTAMHNGAILTCQQWPPTEVPAFQVGRDLPPVPTLLLAGDHDLITPLAWTQSEAARAPRGTLVIIPGSGHITQNADTGPAGREAVANFLTDHGSDRG